MLDILKMIAAIGTIATGLVGLFRPRAITGFIGLEPIGGRGITELRSVLGGVFIAVGAVPLLLNDPVTYQMLGIMYLVVGVIRVISMFIDQSVVRSNIISIVVEFVFGVILVL